MGCHPDCDRSVTGGQPTTCAAHTPNSVFPGVCNTCLHLVECTPGGPRDARIAELEEALKKAHDAMVSWFSSEYANHPLSLEVAAALAGEKGEAK